MKSVRLFWFSFVILAGSMGIAQSNPVPFVSQSLYPAAAAPGSAGFNLTVRGAGFVSGATVNWNGTPLPTTFVSAARLSAAVPPADLAANGTARVTVVNPAPGGGSSDPAFFAITPPASSLVFKSVALNETSATSSISADFNGDGVPDLAVMESQVPSACDYQYPSRGSIAVLLGNGDGTFSKIQTLCVLDYLGSAPLGLQLTGDFNRDGHVDLAVVFFAEGQEHIGAYYGNGNGTFSGPQELYPFPSALKTMAALAYSPYAITGITSGDFFGDGKLHLLASELDTNFNPASKIVALPENSTLFSDASNLYSGPLTSGDFNGDGILDFVQGNGLKVFLNSGGGSFTQKPSVAFGNGGQIVSGDFNGDGIADLATVDGNSLAIMLGHGDGTFTAKSGQPKSTQTNSSLVLADINGDGKLDLVTVDSTNVLSVWLGNGDGTFQSPVDTTGHGDSVIAGDFNGDGKMDLAVTDSISGTVSILLQGSPYQAFIESPINADGSSVFPVRRNRLPVKFSLTENGVPTCTMPPSTIAVTRTAGRHTGLLSEQAYIAPGDKGTNFRIDRSTCQYVYQLEPQKLGPGTYRVDIDISGIAVGDAVFTLR